MPVRDTYIKTVGSLKRLEDVDNDVVDCSVAVDTGDGYNVQTRIMRVFLVI